VDGDLHIKYVTVVVQDAALRELRALSEMRQFRDGSFSGAGTDGVITTPILTI
jgi:hypothetical protein